MSISERTPLINEHVVKEPCWAAPVRATRRYSGMVSQALLLGLDTTFFVSKVAYESTVSKESLVALSALGFIGLPYTVDLIRKTACDAHFGYKASNRIVAILAALRVIELMSNLGLMFCNFAAAVEGVQNEDEAQANIYKSITSFGEAIIVLGMGLNLAFMYVNYRTNKVLTKTDPQLVLEALESPNIEIYNAASLRFCMDKDTLGVLLTKIKVKEYEGLMNIVLANLKTEQKVHLAAKFGFSLLGDGMMAVEKYYTPNSVVSASLNLTAAVAFTVVSLIRYRLEYRQRSKINN